MLHLGCMPPCLEAASYNASVLITSIPLVSHLYHTTISISLEGCLHWFPPYRKEGPIHSQNTVPINYHMLTLTYTHQIVKKPANIHTSQTLRSHPFLRKTYIHTHTPTIVRSSQTCPQANPISRHTVPINYHMLTLTYTHQIVKKPANIHTSQTLWTQACLNPPNRHQHNNSIHLLLHPLLSAFHTDPGRELEGFFNVFFNVFII